MPVECACVDPKQGHLYWPLAAPLIRKAMEKANAGDAYPQVEHDVRNGGALLWFALDKEILAAAVTELRIIRGVKICAIVACGGHDWARFGHLIDRLEAFAKAEGCKKMEIEGRQGWIRLLPEYRVKSVILERDI